MVRGLKKKARLGGLPRRAWGVSAGGFLHQLMGVCPLPSHPAPIAFGFEALIVSQRATHTHTHTQGWEPIGLEWVLSESKLGMATGALDEFLVMTGLLWGNFENLSSSTLI
jgi:hypothetical protein